MRQKCVKNARNTFGGEHLLDDTDPRLRSRNSDFAQEIVGGHFGAHLFLVAANLGSLPQDTFKGIAKSDSEKGVFWKSFRKVHFLEILENLEILEI